MIIQKISYYKNTYTIKSYKEYYNNKITLHEKYNTIGETIYKKTKNLFIVYDENGNSIYYESGNTILINKFNYNNLKEYQVYNTGHYEERKYDENNRLIYMEQGDLMSKDKPMLFYYTYDENETPCRHFTKPPPYIK